MKNLQKKYAKPGHIYVICINQLLNYSIIVLCCIHKTDGQMFVHCVENNDSNHNIQMFRCQVCK